MSKQIQFEEYGPPEVMKLIDVPDPEPGPGQLRVSVRAAGVNPVEYKIRSGFMATMRPMELPAGLGSELAGVVEQLGEGVEGFAPGDAVVGFSVTPAYAELALCEPTALVAKPDSVPFEVAAGVPIAARTAYTVLALLEPKAGETMLVHAAAGGVGLVGSQMAIARGVRVIGTAREDNHEFLRRIGVEPVTYGDGLEERVRALAPDGVDMVFDCSGRGELPMSIELAGGPQRVVTIAAYDSAEYDVRRPGPPEAAKHDWRDSIGEVIGLIEQGRLELPIWRTYPLSEAPAAAHESEHAHLRGKIILLAN
jgi:NADPH:quinone reductase-like Zn-dependent oxidoreductase